MLQIEHPVALCKGEELKPKTCFDVFYGDRACARSITQKHSHVRALAHTEAITRALARTEALILQRQGSISTSLGKSNTPNPPPPPPPPPPEFQFYEPRQQGWSRLKS